MVCINCVHAELLFLGSVVHIMFCFGHTCSHKYHLLFISYGKLNVDGKLNEGA